MEKASLVLPNNLEGKSGRIGFLGQQCLSPRSFGSCCELVLLGKLTDPDDSPARSDGELALAGFAELVPGVSRSSAFVGRITVSGSTSCRVLAEVMGRFKKR